MYALKVRVNTCQKLVSQFSDNNNNKWINKQINK